MWKFSFDRQTGDLWAGEVGQDLWESVYKIESGGNYGWSVTEGSHPFRPDRKKGPTPILKPIVEHPHSDFRSVTGGFVYRGSKYKDLVGAYVYGDYDTGKIAALRYDGKNVTMQQELVDTPFRIITFCEDHAGELYFVDFMNGTIHELVPAPKASRSPPFPRKLSETGLFASTKDHVPAPGLIPYSVNAELWSDHAAQRALPGAAGRRRRSNSIRWNIRSRPPAPARLAVPRRHGRRQDVLDGDGKGKSRRAAAGSKRGFCTSTSSPEPKKSAIRSGADTRTSGTTTRPTPNCSPPRGPIASSQSAMPTRRAECASRPGTSPAGPNAHCATRCPPNTCSASTRCR